MRSNIRIHGVLLFTGIGLLFAAVSSAAPARAPAVVDNGDAIPMCGSDSECQGHGKCSGGSCNHCGSDSDCKTGHCSSGVCGSCGSDSDCHGNGKCSSGQCGNCGSDSECPSHSCSGGRCKNYYP